jgi:hypothetical protein
MIAVWKHAVQHVRVYVLIVFTLLISFATANAGAIVTGGMIVQATDPFADYTDLYPGRPREVLGTHGFMCLEPDVRYKHTSYCSFKPATGIFSIIEVLVAQDDTIWEVDFVMREDVLKVGDLILLWGKPSVHPHVKSINFIWQNGYWATTNYSRHVSFGLSVQKVYFMRMTGPEKFQLPRKE